VLRKGLITIFSTAVLAGFFGGGYMLGQQNNDVATAQTVQQTAELKTSYDALYEALQEQDSEYMLNNVSRAESLQKTQKEWREYIAAKCENEGTVIAYGGTMSAQITQGCLEAETTQRTKELKDLLKLSQ